MKKLVALSILAITSWRSLWPLRRAGRARASAGGRRKKPARKRDCLADVKPFLDDPEVFWLDVREQSEYDAGHIPGVTLIPTGRGARTVSQRSRRISRSS